LNRSPIGLWEMLPLFFMVVPGKQNLEPWMRQVIDMIDGIQNTIKEMQRGIETLHSAVYQLMMFSESNVPQQPLIEFNNNPPADEQPPVDHPYYPNDKEPGIKTTLEQPMTKWTGEQSAIPEDTNNVPIPGTSEITGTTVIQKPPSLLPAEMPPKDNY